MATFVVGFISLVVGFVGGWFCYSKFGAKVQSAEIAFKK